MFRFPAAASLLLLGAAGAAAEPRSAIPWLTETLRGDLPAAVQTGRPAGPVEVSSLGDLSPDGAGLLPPAATGLPEALWGDTTAFRARALLLRVRGEGVPSARDAFRMFLLAETVPPRAAGREAAFLRTRIDRLVALGAVEEAHELLAISGVTGPGFAARAFDLALLTGQEARACDRMLARPADGPADAPRIFCLARTGAWAEAAAQRDRARAAGALDPVRADLLGRFLETTETPPGTPVPLPDPLTPLDHVMLVAIGAGAEALAETGLPPAFQALDLAGTATPRARMLAAEHLVRAGGVTYPILFYAYRYARPAASGGVWDRAAAVQALDRALAAGDPAAVAATLDTADAALSSIGLRVALAREFAPGLAALPVAPELPRERMLELLLLGGAREGALAWIGDGLAPRLRAALAVTEPALPVADTGDALADAALAAFAAADPAEDLADFGALAGAVAAGRVGDAILGALHLLDQGTGIDPGDLTTALRVLALAGQEDIARRIAVETLLLAGRAP